MPRLDRALALAALAVVLNSGMSAAQQMPPPKPSATVPAKPTPRDAKPEANTSGATSEPSAWDQTKAMTRTQWNEAKKKWAMEKVKWRDCNRQSDKQKLAAPKSWSFVASCMTKT